MELKREFEYFDLADMSNTDIVELDRTIEYALRKGKDILFSTNKPRFALKTDSCHKKLEDITVNDLRIPLSFLRRAHRIELIENGVSKVLKDCI